MEKEELLELLKGMREDDRKRLADASIPAAGEERFVPVRNGRARILYHSAEAGAPVFINVHGGGFVAGVPEGDNLFCKRVNEQLKIHVVNVEYRLAPEVMFPGDKEDVLYGGRHSPSDSGSFYCMLQKRRGCQKYPVFPLLGKAGGTERAS